MTKRLMIARLQAALEHLAKAAEEVEEGTPLSFDIQIEIATQQIAAVIEEIVRQAKAEA